MPGVGDYFVKLLLCKWQFSLFILRLHGANSFLLIPLKFYIKLGICRNVLQVSKIIVKGKADSELATA